MKNIYYLLALLFVMGSCTDLEEELRQDLPTGDDPDPVALLESAYNGMRLPYQDQSRVWAAQQHTSDETIGPTRGGDWDDNGIWRTLHGQDWPNDHAFLASSFSELLQIVFTTTNLLQFSPDATTEAQSRLLRAFVVNTVLDGWGQVPFREAGSSLLENAQVLGPQEAVDFIVSETDAIIGNLPDGPTHIANKDAALVLKMKALLNKGMYLNRESPSFDPSDMSQVISIADQIINSGKYSLSQGIAYFDNFAPNNDQISTENIWTALNEGGSNSGNVRSRWFCTLHYNQNPSGWNGFTTLSEFYDSFEDNDIRKGGEYAGMTDISGIRAGFLFGQQFDQDGNALQDRKGNPLAFTKEVSPIETGNNLEVTGIRVIKYPIDYNGGDNADNDYVYYRYADVLLMKAEAMMRSGNNGGALSIVNEIRAARGASMLSSLNESELLAERSRELYWEGHRRTDQLRFGSFLESGVSTSRLLFPIPPASLASNPNLIQNPGYE